MTSNDISYPYGIWMWSGQGRLEAINDVAERYGGVRAQEIIGMEYTDLIRNGLYDRSAVPNIFETKGLASVTSQSQRTGITTVNTGRPYFDPQNSIEHIVVYERQGDGCAEDVSCHDANWTKSFPLQDGSLSTLSSAEKGFEAEGIIAENSTYRKVLETGLKLARSGVRNILVLGETGTGKGLLADVIHKYSTRGDKPLVQINCAALPENLLEAELFGYEKGAFTGAYNKGKAGLFEVAHGGTVFLDEIGDLPLSLQGKLLKYLDDYQVMRLGSTKPRKADCTVIAATNRDVDQLVQQGDFRKDLYYRINPFVLKIPPLRERPDDIHRLIGYFWEKYTDQFQCRRAISPELATHLQSYSFPGNVRELKNIIKKAVVLDESVSLEGSPVASREVPVMTKGTSLKEQLREFERKILIQAQARCRNTREMAAYLGIDQSNVVRKLKKHNLSLSTMHFDIDE